MPDEDPEKPPRKDGNRHFAGEYVTPKQSRWMELVLEGNSFIDAFKAVWTPKLRGKRTGSLSKTKWVIERRVGKLLQKRVIRETLEQAFLIRGDPQSAFNLLYWAALPAMENALNTDLPFDTRTQNAKMARTIMSMSRVQKLHGAPTIQPLRALKANGVKHVKNDTPETAQPVPTRDPSLPDNLPNVPPPELQPRKYAPRTLAAITDSSDLD